MECFTPTPDQLRDARQVVTRFDQLRRDFGPDEAEDLRQTAWGILRARPRPARTFRTLVGPGAA